MKFSLWAPFARSVEIVLQEERLALQRDGAEHWCLELDPARARAGYRYSLDGGEPMPDPRSRWQPEGVHGASHVVSLQRLHDAQTSRFRARPLAEAVIYELHVGTFTAEGTYGAALGHLPHLLELGVTHLELMPLATFPGRRGWGYDGVCLYAPFPGYGTPEELAGFIDACHAQGFAVLLDVVYNHLGPEGNYLACFGPYFSDRVKTTWGASLNFDGPYSDAVRQYVIDNALMWLRDYGFDGLRLDAVHAIYSFEAVHLLEDLSHAVRQLGRELDRDIVLIAESDLNDPRVVRATELGGYGMDAHWADDLHHGIHRFFTAESTGYYGDYQGLADIATALREGYVYQGQYSLHRRRRHGRAPRDVQPQQLVVALQNHDQIGNRAVGDRLNASLTTQQLKAAAALVLLSPFVPLMFQGEEWGARTPFAYFTDFLDPQLRAAVAQGRRDEFAAFGWQQDVPDPQADATFLHSKLDWSEPARPPHAELLAWYRSLIRIRALKARWSGAPRAEVAFDTDALWLRLLHAGVLVVFNFAAQAQSVPLPSGAWMLALTSEPDDHGDGELMSAGGTRVFTARQD